MIAAVVGVVATVVVVAASFAVGRRSASREQSQDEPSIEELAALPQTLAAPHSGEPVAPPHRRSQTIDEPPTSAQDLASTDGKTSMPPRERTDEPAALPRRSTSNKDAESRIDEGGPLRGSLPTDQDDAAQVQDHAPAAREGPIAAAHRGPPRCDGPPVPESTDPVPLGTTPNLPFRSWLGLRVDGTTSWALRPPPGGFPLRKKLDARLRRGSRAVELVDHHGEVVELALERAKGGGVKLLTGALALILRNQFAEIQIRAVAVETEGLEPWFMRELPRAMWWLLGVQLPERATPRELADDLHELGVYQRRIEMCLDLQGLELYPGLAHHLVGGPAKRPYIPRPGVESGVEIGLRERHGLSMVIYDKLAELASQRGPEHAGLLGALEDAGYEPGSPLLRIEARLQGQGLVLEADGERLDGSHPFAALDRELLGRLWWDSLTRVWLADASKGAGRMRDNPMHPVWAAARQAGYQVDDEQQAPARTRRAALQRQLESSQAHGREQLGRAAAACAALDGVDDPEDVPEAAQAALEDALGSERLGEWFLRARARYRVLLDGLGGDDDEPPTGPRGPDVPPTPSPQPGPRRANGLEDENSEVTRGQTPRADLRNVGESPPSCVGPQPGFPRRTERRNESKSLAEQTEDRDRGHLRDGPRGRGDKAPP